jgi:hypothetical protein
MEPEPTNPTRKHTTSSTLNQKIHIALQDGFENEEVVVICNDHEVFRAGNVQTDWRIGLATSFELSQNVGPVHLTVILPRQGLKAIQDFELLSTKYVGVSYTDNNLSIKIKDEPFGYV